MWISLKKIDAIIDISDRKLNKRSLRFNLLEIDRLDLILIFCRDRNRKRSIKKKKSTKYKKFDIIIIRFDRKLNL